MREILILVPLLLVRDLASREHGRAIDTSLKVVADEDPSSVGASALTSMTGVRRPAWRRRGVCHGGHGAGLRLAGTTLDEYRDRLERY